MLENLINGLNKEQKEAVVSKQRRNLILAGAGSGKTKVLTTRIAYLISLGVEPTSILAVTFTNKAAGEMKNRIVSILNGLDLESPFYEKDLSVGTFHSICCKLLRRHYKEAGLIRDFTIIDSDEQKSFIKEIVEEKLNMASEITDKKEKRKVLNNIIQTSINKIGDYKDNGLSPEEVVFTREEYQLYGFDLKLVYETYEEEKSKLNLLDFGDLIMCVVDLLKSNTVLKNSYKEMFRHILVDEFQDTNKIQSELIDLLHDKEEGYLFVVGDDDQSIYEWRGANIENILNFDKKYKNVKTIKLEQNYRSTNNILECANKLISHNKNRKGKSLWSDKDNGDKIKLNKFNTTYEESNQIAKSIKKKISVGVNPTDIAILYRSNYISRVIESKLSENQISYTIIGGVGFWSRLEIKDLMSYLSLVVNNKNNMAFDRIINTPSRKIGKKKIEQISAKAESLGVSRFEALKEILRNKEITGQAAKGATEFVNLIESVMDENNVEEELSIYEKLEILLNGSNLVEYYQEKTADKAEEREANLVELINAAKFFKNENPLEESDEVAFITYAVLQSTADKNADSETVQLMTVHAAKGLEFKHVYLMAWEDGIFPSDNAMRDGKLEEERRLAYVAITRAEQNLEISCAAERFPGVAVSPSRFIGELPRNLLLVKEEQRGFSNNYYKRQPPKSENNWNKSRSDKGFKIGSKFKHSKYGEGLILSVTDAGDRIELKIKFTGFVGIKKLFIEKK